MKKSYFLFVLLIVGLISPIDIFGQVQEVEIQVSPHVLNLQNNGVVVTVHTDISFWSVQASTVSLNGIVIQSWKADDRGYFVAKFNSDEVKKLDFEIGSYNTMTLKGKTILGEIFSGSEDILILENINRSKN